MPPFNLDEYVGIDRNHPESYYTFMNKNLFSGLDIPAENVHLPYGDTKEDCDAYEKAMEHVQVDIQLLGIGGNGHIGFNEPGTSFDETTHIVELQRKEQEKTMLVSLIMISIRYLRMPLRWVLRRS